ncbi:MAG: hypothetical protein DRH12_00370 [Deltaproteobacteria bacterium]|nr:MAG: hypothetical protein DRH12_00370 [Deltaproteobacteria bacterium]
MEPNNRREFVRAKVSFPAKFHFLEGEDFNLARQGLGITLFRGGDQPDPLEEFISTMPTNPQTSILYQCFKNFNNKLDFIIEELTLPAENRINAFKEVVELSGSGFKFLSNEPVVEGSLAKVDLIIPSTVQFRIELIAEIIRCVKDDKSAKYVIAAKILEIDESARDAIIESVFKKQRKIIRKEKALREAKDEQGRTRT